MSHIYIDGTKITANANKGNADYCPDTIFSNASKKTPRLTFS